MTFDKIELQRVAVSAVAALALTATCVFGAVAPVKAATPVTLSKWTDQVEERIAGLHMEESRFQPSTLRIAAVAAHFTAEGDFTGATLAKSSGDAAIDRRAVQIARSINVPRLPEAVRGSPRTVLLRLLFGDAGSIVEPADGAGRIDTTQGKPAGIQVAAR